MKSLEETAKMLRDFGLTVNQAKILIAISQLEIATISKISNMSKVRREDVYRNLPILEQMGVIERILGTPAKIKAIPSRMLWRFWSNGSRKTQSRR